MSDHKETVNSLREHADLIETSIELYGPSAIRLLVYDLRNAAAAIEALQADVKRLELENEDYEYTIRERYDEPKRGEWIKLDMHKGMEQYKCSVCGAESYVPGCMGEPLYAYCPMCGAKMEVQHG